MLRGLVGALIGGLIAAAAWALIAYYLNRESTLVALGVGVLVGKGMQYGLTESPGTRSGAIAALVALATIVAGKFAAVQIIIREDMERAAFMQPVNEEACKIQLGFAVMEELEKEGKSLKWPEGRNADNLEHFEEFPDQIRNEVDAEWMAMTPEEKTDFTKATQLAYDQYRQDVAADASVTGFVNSFSFYDILWGALAMAAAAGIGSTAAPKQIT